MKATVEILKEIRFNRPVMYVINPTQEMAISALTKKQTVNEHDLTCLKQLGLEIEIITANG